jgi:L-lactate dehydrogenase complex protein LldG
VVDLEDAEALTACDAGLGGADLLIAESATLVLVDGPHEPRGLSLLPPVHLCVAFASRLVPRIHDALARLGPGGDAWPVGGAAPTLTLITGPSRTADIEKTLVVPAHGPAALHVFLVMDGD